MLNNRPLTVEFGTKIINTGKYTMQDAYAVALRYGAEKDETIRYRVTMTREEISNAISTLECRRIKVEREGLDATPARRRDWGVINATNAERDVLHEKIARLRNLYRNYDNIIDA